MRSILGPIAIAVLAAVCMPPSAHAQVVFTDVTGEAGIALTDWLTESVAWGDDDNDGDEDLYLTVDGPNHLYRNDGGGRFTDVTDAAGVGNQGFSVGSAFGDLDNDGDLDLLVLNLNGPARLYRNDGGNRGNWIMVRTVGTAGNRDGIGARIRVTSGGTTQVRDIRSSSGYLSQSDPRAHFGIGKSKKVDRIEVRWPSGRTSTLDNVKVNQVITVTEPEVKKK